MSDSMKRLLPILMILMAAPAANAGGLVHKMSSSVQLTVDSARSTATRLGNQYSISGSNVGTSDGSTAGMLTSGTISSGVYAPELLQQTNLMQLVEKHSPSAPRSYKVMHFQLLLHPLVLFPTSDQLQVMQLELLVIWLVLSKLMVLLRSRQVELAQMPSANLLARSR